MRSLQVSSANINHHDFSEFIILLVVLNESTNKRERQ